MTSIPVGDQLASLQHELRDRYAVEAKIGSGGMADVYRAVDLKHGRPVAVKVLRREVGDAMGADRFAREIEIAARLQHPNILAVYDSGQVAGTVFYTMPYLVDGSLRTRLDARERLPLGEVLDIVREVADALAFAHRCNIVHRDVKPENILFVAGHAVVADFGIARAIETVADERLTLAGFGVGTPEYVSPEQAFGEKNIDGRSDVYSLACVAYEMLAGVPPHTGGSAAAVLHHKTTQAMPSLAVTRPDLGLAACDVVLERAMSLEPADRFSSAVAFASALREAATGGQATVVAPRPDTGASIAVLPFSNVGAGSDDDYLSDGITDELTYALGRLPGLRVVARTSAFMFKDKADDVRVIGQKLSVQHILEGTLRRAGNRLRITARLVDATTGYDAWTERYDRDFTDVFAVQDDITSAIAQAMRVELLHETRDHVQTSQHNVIAYERFLEARFQWNRRTETGSFKSVSLLREVIELDPVFIAARAALAESYITLAIYGQMAPDEAMPPALEAAEHALRADPMQPNALAARGSVRAMYEWKWEAAEEDFKRAVASDPQTPTVYQWYAMHLLVPLRRFEDARAQLATARRIDPLSSVVASSWALCHYFEGDYGRAIAEQEELLRRDPGFGMAHFFIGQAAIAAGEPDRALEHLHLASTLVGETPEIIATIGVASAAAGDAQTARDVLEALEHHERSGYVSPVLQAQIHAAIGDTNAGLDALDRARTLRATDLAWISVRPTFDVLRLQPRFNDLMQSVGLGAQITVPCG
jgi:serine/threonine-protein kinase